MGKAIRRSKKINSDNDNLFIYEDDTAATFGSVPYEPFYDYGKNSVSHMSYTLYFNDNNTFENSSERINFVKTYKI